MNIRISFAIVLGLGSLVGACSSANKDACARYCQSEVRCDMIAAKDARTCEKACRAHLQISAATCESAFQQYAACYGQSQSCAADECFDRFASFADRCPWYTNEIALTALTKNHPDSAASGEKAAAGSLHQ